MTEDAVPCEQRLVVGVRENGWRLDTPQVPFSLVTGVGSGDVGQMKVHDGDVLPTVAPLEQVKTSVVQTIGGVVGVGVHGT